MIMMTATYRQIPELLKQREPFEGHSMRARRVQPGEWTGHGRLPFRESEILRHAQTDAERFGEELYVVFSYATPIAWGLDGRELYVPDTRYSVTTSRQQSLCRAA